MRQLFSENPTNQSGVRSVIYRLLTIGAMLAIAACGGGGSSSGGSSIGGGVEAASYTLGGSVSGLSVSGLVLQNNGADDLVIAANASTFQFATPVAAGSAYNVTVFVQPAGLTCTVSNGTGTKVDAAITDVTVVCKASTYTVAGTITGLATDGLVLRNNGADDLVIAANASTFQFATPVIAGESYNVTVATQPVGLTCTVSNGTGANVHAAIADVTVVCNASTYTIAGTISGLATNGLVLRNNGADDLVIASNASSFHFATPVAAGSGYNVTVFVQPAGLTCTVSDGVGNNVSTDITNIHIACSAITFTIGGTITGLTKSGLVLQNNGGDNLTIAANATAFEFATQVAYGGGYAITVLTQPTGQSCLISNAAGNATTQVSDIALTCTEVVLPPSVSTLALAVNNTALNTALTGVPRQIIITNTGSVAATQVSILYPIWPSGTTTTTNCGTTLPVGASCTITITPGSVATSDCHTGTAPTPGTITVSADDALDRSIDVVVLSYGCIYQQGFLFSIDDTTPNTGSIGGKVAALNDETPILWSSTGISDPDFTAILGIDETSTTSFPSPSGPPYPVGTPAYTPCDGSVDGACNTSNILSYYIFNRAEGGSAPTPLTQYAAGVCHGTINGYGDWYLPAICEAGYGNDLVNVVCGTSSSPTIQNMQSNLVDIGVGNLDGFRLSSTQYSFNPSDQVWVHNFSTIANDTYQVSANRVFPEKFRCVRGLTQ
jgi:hypothetical protein